MKTTALVVLLASAPVALGQQQPTQQGPLPAPQAPQQGNPKSPEQRLAELRKELEKLQRELAHTREMIEGGTLGKRLVRNLRNRELEFRTTDTTIGSEAKTEPEPQKARPEGPRADEERRVSKGRARPMTEDMKERLLDDVVCLVRGAPVRNAEVEKLLAYFKSYPNDHSEIALKRRALREHLEVALSHASFPRGKVQAAKEIRKIKSSIDAGNDFGDLARNRSAGPGAAQDGDIGWIGRGSAYGPILERHAFALEPGDVSDPFATALGYAIIRVTDKEEGETADQDQVRVGLILLPYIDALEELRQLQTELTNGSAPIFYRDADVLELLPEVYR